MINADLIAERAADLVALVLIPAGIFGAFALACVALFCWGLDRAGGWWRVWAFAPALSGLICGAAWLLWAYTVLVGVVQ